jgi:two-component sensor histidine kinase
VALLFHESATNSSKYGSLQSDAGHVDVTWSVNGDMLILRWAEHGGLEVVGPPHSKGFGADLIDGTIRQFGGTIEYSWDRKGLSAILRLPVRALDM